MRTRPVKIGGQEIISRIDKIEAMTRVHSKLIMLHSIIIVCAVCAWIVFL